MTDLLQAGIIFFNAGRYFEAHEAWEDLWRATRGPLRLFYQGLVQAAVGMHHLGRGNLNGAQAQTQQIDCEARTVSCNLLPDRQCEARQWTCGRFLEMSVPARIEIRCIGGIDNDPWSVLALFVNASR